MSKKKKRDSPWKPTGETAIALGVTDEHLYTLRDEGLLKRGKHWRDVSRPGAVRKTYRWHLRSIEQVLEQIQETRG